MNALVKQKLAASRFDLAHSGHLRRQRDEEYDWLTSRGVTHVGACERLGLNPRTYLASRAVSEARAA